MAIYGTLGDIELAAAEYPLVQPTLDLNFAKTKTLDPRITFYRNSIGTYTDERGVVRTVSENVPRFDHDPATGESLGLLIEESRTNLHLQSSNYNDSSWTKNNITITANSTLAPDNTTTAYLVIPTTSNSSHTLLTSYLPSFTVAPVTVSIFVKSAGATWFSMRGDNQTNFCNFNILTGDLGSVSSSNSTTASIQKYPNGWYKCSITYTPINNGCDPEFWFANSSTYGGGTYAGDGINGYYVWGAQFEQGSFPTSYIPTSASAVTRAPDISRIAGTNFSSWYNQLEGSYIIKYRRGYTGAAGVFPGLLSTNSLFVFSNGSFEHVKNQNANVQLQVGAPSTLEKNMYIMYSSAGYGGGLDGAAPATGSQVFGTSDSYLDFGVVQGPTQHRISRLMYYPERLTNLHLQNLTA